MALLLSHGAALVLTGLGDGLPLLTVQPADRPWETGGVLPVAWVLVLWAVRSRTSQTLATLLSPDPLSEATTGSRVALTVRDRPYARPTQALPCVDLFT